MSVPGDDHHSSARLSQMIALRRNLQMPSQDRPPKSEGASVLANLLRRLPIPRKAQCKRVNQTSLSNASRAWLRVDAPLTRRVTASQYSSFPMRSSSTFSPNSQPTNRRMRTIELACTIDSSCNQHTSATSTERGVASCLPSLKYAIP